jgi:RHS repeat-associated protein
LGLTHAGTDGGAVDLQVDFKYDAFGNRIEKAHDADGTGGGSAVVTRFALDGWKNVRQPLVGNENWDVWADLDGSSSLTTRYVRGDVIDQLFARIEEDAGGDIPYWYLTDHLGSIRDVIDGSAVVKDSITYDGFGNITAETDSNYRGRYAWTGREIDGEIDLQHNRARYYDAVTGRWASQDPLGFVAGDINLYRYAGNDYINFTDPSGLNAWGVGLGAGAAFEGGLPLPFCPIMNPHLGIQASIGYGAWPMPVLHTGGYFSFGVTVGLNPVAAGGLNGWQPGGILGGYFGGGFGFFFTNALDHHGLDGWSQSTTLNTPFFSGNVSISGNGTWIGQAEFGPWGLGASISSYPTWTWSFAGAGGAPAGGAGAGAAQPVNAKSKVADQSKTLGWAALDQLWIDNAKAFIAANSETIIQAGKGMLDLQMQTVKQELAQMGLSVQMITQVDQFVSETYYDTAPQVIAMALGYYVEAVTTIGTKAVWSFFA